MLRALLIAVVVCVTSSASAQIIYAPVQYQFGGQSPYYYGGSDPDMHRYANMIRNDSGTWGRINGWAFASGNVDTHREVASEPPRVFCDALPRLNAWVYGYTPTDARNDAYFNIPRYFRKSDMLKSGLRGYDGAWVVPAKPVQISAAPLAPGTIQIRKWVKPATARKPTEVFVFPKDMLDKVVPGTENPERISRAD